MDFLTNHSVLTLIFLAIFPRITLLVASSVTGGFFWWLGWLFAPHFLVAILSMAYWDTDPVLVVIAWIMACVGSGSESRTAGRITRNR